MELSDRYDYIAVNNTAVDSDSDLLTCMLINGQSGQACRYQYVCNWECQVADRTASILPTAPAVIDMEDLQRGLRKLAMHQTVSDTQFLSREGGGIGGGSAPSTSSPAIEPPIPPTGDLSGRANVMADYMDQAAEASDSLRRIALNSAAVAGTVLPMVAGTRAIMRRT